MVMDQAGWHIAQELEAPQNMRLVLLAPYSQSTQVKDHSHHFGKTRKKTLDM
jgi:hypothetical protein